MAGTKSKGMIAIGALSLALWMGTTLYTNADGSSSTQPGMIDDPLVTKSYVDKSISELVKQEVANQMKGSNGQPTASTAPTSTPTPTLVPNISGTGSSGITVVQLKTGQTLYAASGAELIVRSGKTLAVSSDENGIPDVTSGKDIAANGLIELNHMLVFPREGRGIKPDTKNTQDIFVMVRGGYTIYNADGTKVIP